jgi:hypothetical protein
VTGGRRRFGVYTVGSVALIAGGHVHTARQQKRSHVVGVATVRVAELSLN